MKEKERMKVGYRMEETRETQLKAIHDSGFNPGPEKKTPG